MKNLLLTTTIITLILSSCIKDDILFDTVDPVIRITNPIDTIEINTNFQFEFNYLNNVGQPETVTAVWSSSDPSIINISNTGLAEALAEGSATLRVTYNDGENDITDELTIVVGNTTVVTAPTDRTGTIAPTSFYELEGDFTLSANGADLVLAFDENYKASSALPGLYVYLSNNPNSVAGAYEIGKVEVFSGAHQYDIPNTMLQEYSHLVYFCKPFNVKVGDGTIN